MSFNPDNPRRKALIAMSGGVDSSVAAYLAIERGLDCIGVTMKLFDNEDAGISREKSCCSLEDTEYARGVAYRLGMPYYVFNFTADFKKQVMDRFVAAYANADYSFDRKYSISEISSMVGFNSPSYFATSFKKHVGCLPTEYVRSRTKGEKAG